VGAPRFGATRLEWDPEDVKAHRSTTRIYRLDAVRGHLFEMLGDLKAAAEHYRAAARRTTSLPEQHYLTTQAARLSSVGRRQR
jgi:predicted RNA polymerase sigma factor